MTIDKIVRFYVYAFYCNPGHYGLLYDHLLNFMAQVQSVDEKEVFVCVTHIAGNRCDHVMTDGSDRVDVFVCTPLFVKCGLRVEQSVPKYNVRSTVFKGDRTNWDSVCGAVWNLTWSTILKSADPLDALNRTW